MSEAPNKSNQPDLGAAEKFSFFPEPPQRWIDGLRDYLRDLPELNILLEGNFESTDEQLGQAWGRALGDWNRTEPIITDASFQNHPSKILLFQKAIAEALKSISIFHARNNLQYTDAGNSYSINDKHREFQPLIDRYENAYELAKVNVKAHINMDAAWGHVHTDFNRGANFLSGF